MGEISNTVNVVAVPDDRKINNKALSADIALNANDVGALPITGGTLTGDLALQRNLNCAGLSTSSKQLATGSGATALFGNPELDAVTLGTKSGVAYVRSGASTNDRIYHEGYKPRELVSTNGLAATGWGGGDGKSFLTNGSEFVINTNAANAGFRIDSGTAERALIWHSSGDGSLRFRVSGGAVGELGITRGGEFYCAGHPSGSWFNMVSDGNIRASVFGGDYMTNFFVHRTRYEADIAQLRNELNLLKARLG